MTYTISGGVSGLAANNGGLVLQDNGADNLTVTANGAFQFATALKAGSGYKVTVLTQPSNPAQQCTVQNGVGTAAASVSNITVTCVTTYTISGTVSGLSTNSSGLVLQDNGADNLSIAANGAFQFATALKAGSGYKVMVLNQPSNPAQQCAVQNGVGTATANVTTITVTCASNDGMYTISGSVADLATNNGGLVLQDNGGDNHSITANGAFHFATAVKAGTGYSVTVLMPPSYPTQQCTVANGIGTATADVSSITVECGHNEWAWMAGSQNFNTISTYGTLGSPAAGNTPGGRQTPATWTDASGDLWLFGGYGKDSNGTLLPMNDLWKFSAGEWTWMGGSTIGGQNGIYGTLGVASPNAFPGARFEAASWTDASGTFWLLGGLGFDAGGNEAYLNDLWKYSEGQWTWMGGSNLVNNHGRYGTLGVADANNVPGARGDAAIWVDPSGNLWLFGGSGYDATSASPSALSDLWKYSNGQWTWMGGPQLNGQKGIYGTQGTADAANIPGARFWAYSWVDASGNLWLFGGNAYDSSGTSGEINDLWKYSKGQWTWVGGSNLINQPGVCVSQGVASATNIPGARGIGVAWADDKGNAWIFGGNGRFQSGQYSELNDLWKYSGGEWTWVSGSTGNQSSTYGTEGVPYPGNIPGGRSSSAAWKDTKGNFWLFGGVTIGSNTAENLNDLWMYIP